MFQSIVCVPVGFANPVGNAKRLKKLLVLPEDHSPRESELVGDRRVIALSAVTEQERS